MSILSLSFNQSISHLVACSENGYVIYELSPKKNETDNKKTDIEKKKSVDKGGGVGLMKMFHTSNICLLVGGGINPFKPKDTVVMRDDYKNSDIMEIDLQKPIKNILIDDVKTIVCVLQKELLVFNFDGKLQYTKPTYSNDRGLCCLHVKEGKQMIATLGMKKGEVAIWNINQESYKVIQAHNSNIEIISMNQQGTLLGTASETGTLIKIFNIASGKQLYEFRRGSTSAKIYDICFNKDSTIITCCSSNGTVHIFELYKDEKETKNAQSYLSGFKEYLPSYFGSQWGFKQISIPSTDRMICGFDSNNTLHIASLDGKYYKLCGPNFDNLKQSELHVNSK